MDISSVMSRNNFKDIRSALKCYPTYDVTVASADPLWHSRNMLNHFMKNCANIAVPHCVTSFDEIRIRCKARTLARTFMKNKPIRYGLTFYALVSWLEPYLFGLFDNRSGNSSGVYPADAFCTVFHDLRGVLKNKLVWDMVKPSSASALWSLQLAQQTKKKKDPHGKRLVVMDNYYTRHFLAEQTKIFSDGEISILGTVKLLNTDGRNKAVIEIAKSEIKDAERGSWRLTQVFNKDGSVAQNAGYIVFKDRAVVVFYTNDLASTPIELINSPNDTSIACVRGLAPLKRWIGNEAMHRTVLMVPVPIVAYNIFMNGVDRFDQYRSTNPMTRKERRVPLSIFTFLLDASVQNAFAIRKTIDPQSSCDYREFKRFIAEQLVIPYLNEKKNQSVRRARSTGDNDEGEGEVSLGSILSNHMLLENDGKRSANCYLCSLMTKDTTKRTSIYGCVQCKQAFHVNCFTLYHFRDALNCHRPVLVRLMRENAGSQGRKRRRRENKVTSTLKNARLPFPI